MELLLKELLEPLHIFFTEIDELIGITIERDILLQENIIKTYHEMIPKLKNEYHSDMLSCLHQNSLDKQKFPAICMLRQILKTNGLQMKSMVTSMGYNKTNGKKITRRYFIIQKID